MKKCIRKITAFILMLCVVISSSGLQTIKLMANTGSHVYEYDGYRILYNVVNEWDGGIQVDVTITNTSDESIKNWGVKLSIQGQIQSIWNVTIKDVAEGIYILSNNGYNSEILAGQSVNFGYVLSGDKFSVPEKISLTQEKREVANGYEIQYVLTNDWGTGFQGTMRIINKKDEPIENWQLDFESNVVLNNVWNAQWKEQDGKYTLTAYNWLKDIQVGDAIEIGFTGDKSENTEVVFDNFYMTEIVVYPKIGENLENESTESVSEEQESTEAENETNESTEQESTETEIQPTTEATTEEWTEDVSECETETQSEAETNQCTEPVTEDIIIDYKKDSDGDMLSDYLEESYGCDKNNPDTDGDGLPDGYEVYYTYTNPTLIDTDSNGITDDREDFDMDKLDNITEYIAGTDPWNDDSDYDGLNDYDELYVYMTSPIKYDTDNDNVSDLDEIMLGLNPNAAETFGYSDNEYVTDQKVTGNSWIMSDVNDNSENPFVITASIKAAGVAENNLSAQISRYDNVINNEAIIGKSAELIYNNGLKMDEIIIEFHLEESVVQNTNRSYMNISDEFVGIKRLNIFKYFEDINMLLPVETFHDLEHNIVYTKDNSVGTYCIMDMEIWLESVGFDPDGNNDLKVTSINIDDNTSYNNVVIEKENEYMVYADNTADSNMIDTYSNGNIIDSYVKQKAKRYTSMDQVEIGDYKKIEQPMDIVFQIEASGKYFYTYKYQVDSTIISAQRFFQNMSDVRVKLLFHYSLSNYLESEWFSNIEDFEEWLNINYYNTENYGGFINNSWSYGKHIMFEKFWKSNPYREKANKLYIDYWNSSLSSSLGETMRNAVKKGEIYLFDVSYSKQDYDFLYGHIIPRENSSISDIVGGLCSTNAELLGNCVANQILDDYGERVYIVSSTGLKRMTRSFFLLDSLGKLDYDDDGLANIDEINMESGLIKKIAYDEYEFPTLLECLEYGNVFTMEGLNRFYNGTMIAKGLKEYMDNIRVLPLKSDPTMRDSDGDGILDNVYDKDGNIYNWVKESEDVFNFSDDNPLRKDIIFEWPVINSNKNKENKMTAGFTEKRNKMTTFHNAIDIAAEKDTPVYATYSGVVLFVTPNEQWCNDCYGPSRPCSCGKGFGNHVSILVNIDGKQYIIRYSHLNQINRGQLVVGELVKQGTLIGAIGSTGSSQGYHLDYSISEIRSVGFSMGEDKVSDIYIDPILFDSKQSRYEILEVNIKTNWYIKIPKNLENKCSGIESQDGKIIYCYMCSDYLKAIKKLYQLKD